MKKVKLADITEFLDGYCLKNSFRDYDGSFNGLQFENSGWVSSVACAVDAGVYEFSQAAKMGADLLIVHHGMFGREFRPIVGASYRKMKILMDADIAVYSMHLPLDAHAESGNNVLIAKALGLEICGTCIPVENRNVGVLVEPPEGGREGLVLRLKKLFPETCMAIEFGPENPKGIAVCSGSCGDVVEYMPSLGIDTLVCGELRQRHFAMAQELGLNLYPCGHYATETFGVRALADITAGKFGLKSGFISVDNPL